MRIIQTISDWIKSPSPTVFAVGFFDGIHLGHQAVLTKAITEAHLANSLPGVLTFHPHPAHILRPASAPASLSSRQEKYEFLQQFGIQLLLEIPFDLTFANWTPSHFIHSLCTDSAFAIKGFCTGENWTFGHDRTGNVSLLEQFGITHGFSVHPIPPIELLGSIISSTRIRSLIASGNLSEAALCLGRPFSLSGTVRHGQKLGRTIGFPTANLSLELDIGKRALPPYGVYAVQAKTPNSTLTGIANLGIRPTLSQPSAPQLEIHFFDFSGDLYDQSLEVSFLHFLRPEQKFPSLDALQAQIHIDSQTARSLLPKP